MSTLQQKQASLAALTAARDAIATGAQEYSIEGSGSSRRVRKADFAALCEEIRRLEADVARLQPRRIYRLVPGR